MRFATAIKIADEKIEEKGRGIERLLARAQQPCEESALQSNRRQGRSVTPSIDADQNKQERRGIERRGMVGATTRTRRRTGGPSAGALLRLREAPAAPSRRSLCSPCAALGPTLERLRGGRSLTSCGGSKEASMGWSFVDLRRGTSGARGGSEQGLAAVKSAEGETRADGGSKRGREGRRRRRAGVELGAAVAAAGAWRAGGCQGGSRGKKSARWESNSGCHGKGRWGAVRGVEASQGAALKPRELGRRI